MATKHVCIHGHFYQPPRENPWTGRIDRQPSAAPHPNWNARITAECYAPNAAARILDESGTLRRTFNNYAAISFNFGPTLLDWLERHAAETYQTILDADRARGAALAQVHGHLILPLACARDRSCQVAWGVRDFRHRFGRRPRGMWLPETAVDLASLEALAAAGIEFTILAPHQAARVRPQDGGAWRPVTEHSLDTTVAYEQRLPSGRRIVLFFYDGAVSRGIAFESLLRDGQGLADRLLSIIPDEARGPRLAHVATDGETYGHHHLFGEMALAFAADHLGRRNDVELTHYAEFLDLHPPRHEVEIVEPSSWSCSHGVERWRSGCGCGASSQPGWQLDWRAPLREALDTLRDRLAPAFESRAGQWLDDPWVAREEYIGVLLDDAEPAWRSFLERHARRRLADEEQTDLRSLLEMQRYLMAMYTSCGWFFDDPARIESIQVLLYAGRAIELARAGGLADPEPELLARLEDAPSNDPERGTAAELYRKHVTGREPVV